MTWPQAYRIADEQIAFWRWTGVSACDAEQALRPDPWLEPNWGSVRRKLAQWAMEHADKWGGMTVAVAHDNNWMPLYIGDYLRDTARLTVAEHGAYLLLIMDYWVNGPPLDDDRELARIARTPLSTWRQYRRGTLIKLFTAKGGRWFHKRIEAELTHARELNDKKRRGGLASAASRRSRNGTAQPEHRSEDSTQRVRDFVRTPLHCKEEGLAPYVANPVSLTARDGSPPLPSRGDGGAPLRSKRGPPPAPEPSSDSFITPEEKAAALVELHREIRAKAAIMTGIVEA